MDPATHVLAGWCFANVPQLSKKERALCMAASILPDIDGLGLLGGIETYQTYHHVVAHNLTFGLSATLTVTWLTRCSAKASIGFFVLFHLHLLMDLFGSGPGWGIAYFWPWDGHMSYSSHAWSYAGWQNNVFFLLFFGWAVVITFANRRTPLEFIAPRLDSLIVNLIESVPGKTRPNSPKHTPNSP